MRTLDETIKGIEYCLNPVDELGNCNGDCPYCPSCDPEGTAVKLDALHYLQEYRDAKDDLDEKRLKYMKAIADLEDNPPLTWDELKQMRGKPIWIELLGNGWKGWDVIAGFDEDNFGVAIVTVHNDDYYKLDLGKTWQAYRKERINNVSRNND